MNKICIQAGFEVPHSNWGWVGVGSELGRGWLWVVSWLGHGFRSGLGWGWVGSGLGCA